MSGRTEDPRLPIRVPGSKPPSTMEMQYCDSCGLLGQNLPQLHNCSLGPAFVACPGDLRAVVYELRDPKEQ